MTTEVVAPTGAEKALANQGADASNLDGGSAGGKGASQPPAGDQPETPAQVAERIKVAEAAALAAKHKEAAGDPPEPDAAAKAAKEAADKAEADKAKDNEPAITKWAKFNDPTADAVVDILKDGGVSPAEGHKLFGKYLETGDVKDIDRAALEAKIGKAATHLAITGIEAYSTSQKAKHDATSKAVHDLVGGKENWEVVAAWAKVRAEKDAGFAKELEVIRDDISRGGRAAKSAAADLLAIYNGNPNTHGLGNKNIVKGDKTPAETSTPISREQYVTELSKLQKDGKLTPQAEAALNARRTAGKKAGL